MKSRITIDLDPFNRPIIQVEYNPSDDVRDKLVKRFLEGFAHTSIWCRASFDKVQNDGSLLLIRPIPPTEFEENVKELEMFCQPKKSWLTEGSNTLIITEGLQKT